MDDREFEKVYELVRDMNRNIENGLEKINDSLRKISEEVRELKD